MRMIILFILAVAPGIFLVYQIYRQDKVEKEPVGLLLLLVLSGVLLIIPVLIVENLGTLILNALVPEGVLYSLLDAFVVIALVEEAGKFLILKKISWKEKDFNFTFDGIVYAVCASMGFAIIENILYVFSNGIGTALMRAALSIPGHAVFAVYMGLYYGRAKLCEVFLGGKGIKLNFALSICIPVFLHGLYDFCAMSENTFLLLFFFVFIIVLYAATFINLKTYSKNDQWL